MSGPLSVPVRICVNPTIAGLAQPFPHGGVDLGYVRDVRVRVVAGELEIPAEEFGLELYDLIDGGEQWGVTFAVRGLGAQGYAFLETVTGSVTGETGVEHPGATRRAGRSRRQDAVVLLLSPLDHERHQATLFRAAIPTRAVPLELVHGKNDELTYAVSFLAVRDDAGKAAQYKRLADLELAAP